LAMVAAKAMAQRQHGHSGCIYILTTKAKMLCSDIKYEAATFTARVDFEKMT